MNTVSPVTFIDKLIKKNELGQPFRLSDHQREVLRLAFAFDVAYRKHALGAQQSPAFDGRV